MPLASIHRHICLSAFVTLVATGCGRGSPAGDLRSCAVTAQLGALTRAPELDRKPEPIINRRFRTSGGDLVLGDTLPASERGTRARDGVVRMKTHVIDPNAPTFVAVGRGDTIRAIFVAFPAATPYPLAVGQYSRALGSPTYVEGEVSPTERWRSAQWQNDAIFVRVDSFVIGSRPQVCLGMFER
jgi:hypothetical protein